MGRSDRKYNGLGLGKPRSEIDYGGMSRQEVADVLKVTRARVGQIERRALAKLERPAKKLR